MLCRLNFLKNHAKLPVDNLLQDHHDKAGLPSSLMAARARLRSPLLPRIMSRIALTSPAQLPRPPSDKRPRRYQCRPRAKGSSHSAEANNTACCTAYPPCLADDDDDAAVAKGSGGRKDACQRRVRLFFGLGLAFGFWEEAAGRRCIKLRYLPRERQANLRRGDVYP